MFFPDAEPNRKTWRPRHPSRSVTSPIGLTVGEIPIRPQRSR